MLRGRYSLVCDLASNHFRGLQEPRFARSVRKGGKPNQLSPLFLTMKLTQPAWLEMLET